MLMQLIERVVEKRNPGKTREQIQAEVEEEHRTIGRGIAERFSRGNVNIKRGSFLTKHDLKERDKK